LSINVSLELILKIAELYCACIETKIIPEEFELDGYLGIAQRVIKMCQMEKSMLKANLFSPKAISIYTRLISAICVVGQNMDGMQLLEKFQPVVEMYHDSVLHSCFLRFLMTFSAYDLLKYHTEIGLRCYHYQREWLECCREYTHKMKQTQDLELVWIYFGMIIESNLARIAVQRREYTQFI
jgi:hypothetical protein